MEILLKALMPIDFNNEESYHVVEQPLELTPGTIISHLCNELSLLPIEKQSLMNVSYKLPDGLIDVNNAIASNQKMLFEHLIVLLTSGNVSQDLIEHFIITFTLFRSPKYLLACLFARYFTNIASSSANINSLIDLTHVRVQVLKFLTSWMNVTPFVFNVELLGVIEIFYNRVSFGHVSIEERLILNKLNEQVSIISSKDQDEIGSLLNRVNPGSYFSFGANTICVQLRNMGPLAVAHQISLVDSIIFKSIKPKDLMAIIGGQITAKSCPTIDYLQTNFDRLSKITAFSIIFDNDVKLRSATYNLWVHVMFELLKICDFSGLFAVFMGITHPSVERLKTTIDDAWRQMGIKKKMEFERIKQICSFSNNFSYYRKTLQTCKPPIVPFFGCFQKDWVYFQELNNFQPSDNKIDVQIIEKAYELYSTVQKYQMYTYNYEEDPSFLKILLNNSKDLPDSIKLMQISALQESLHH